MIQNDLIYIPYKNDPVHGPVVRSVIAYQTYCWKGCGDFSNLTMDIPMIEAQWDPALLIVQFPGFNLTIILRLYSLTFVLQELVEIIKLANYRYNR